MKINLLLFLLLSIISINGYMITINSNGSGDFTLIQAGIMEATDGDTVLVAPGIYYENINFLGKKITVASEFIFSGDEDDIEGTIIDGGNNDSVVRMESGEDTLSYLCGFVIRNGNYNLGGGVHIYQSGAKLEYLKIRNNLSESPNYPAGGGLYADGDAYSPDYRQMIIRNVEISENVTRGNNARSGGFEIGYRYNLIIMENLLVSDNWVDADSDGSNGGGIIIRARNVFLKNCTISNNLVTGADGASEGGLSMRYVEDVIICNSQIISNSVESYSSGAGGMRISAIGDVAIRDCLIAENSSISVTHSGSGGLSLSAGNLLVEDCEIKDNTANAGAGSIWIGQDCDVIFNRVLIQGNIAADGSVIKAGGADCLMINCIVFNNQSSNHEGMNCCGGGRFRIVNSIFWNNGNSEFYLEGLLDMQIFHSIIENGENGIVCYAGGDYFWGEENLLSSPMFVDAENNDFHLQDGSPGIDSGVNACIKWGSGYYLVPEEEIIGKNRDIGIYETGDEEYYFDLPTYLAMEEDIVFNFNLEEYIEDMIGQFSARYENSLTSMIDNNIISWQPAENWYGFDEVWVYFETAGGETFRDYILVEVLSVNDAPIIELPESISFNNVGHYYHDVLQYIYDIEGHTILLSASGSDHITAWIQNPYLFLEAEAGWLGTETVTVYAEDDGNRPISSDTLQVEVYCQPLAVCGEDIITRDGETIVLDGSGSLDPLQNGLTYLWSADGTLQIENANSAQAIVTLPEINEMEEAMLYLEINDGFNSSIDSLSLEYWDDEPLNVECDIFLPASMIRINWSPTIASGCGQFELLGYQMFFEGCEFDSLQDAANCVYMFILPEGEFDLGVQAVYSEGVSDIIEVNITAAKETELITTTGLTGLFPNPFNPTININYALAEGENVLLEIYNLKGQKVKTLVDQDMEAGMHLVIWNAEKQSSGIYLLQFKSLSNRELRKIMLLK
ncbi:MAG: T9SS type A sorting domain-containing protein [Candidatus Cloacimonetes bacterium]|nr:T9SS type A sorting domain-containing protein [Candidatus Cloacimonadota bacterium]